MDERVKWAGSEKTREFVDSLSLSREKLDLLRAQTMANAMAYMSNCALIVSRGGNIHGVNRKATDRRRAANKRARAARKAQRG